MNSIHYQFISQPIWGYEAASLFSNNFYNVISDIQLKHSDTAEGQAFLNGPFKHFRDFWEQAINDTKCYLTNELSDIYFSTPCDSNSCFFTQFLKELYYKDPFLITDSELHNGVIAYIQNYVSQLSNTIDKDSIQFDSEDSLRQLLSDLKIKDYHSKKILFLYLNYKDIWSKFLTYAKQVIPILKDLFPLIKEDYTTFTRMVGTKQYLDKLLFGSNALTELPFEQTPVMFTIFEFNFLCVLLTPNQPALQIGYLFSTLREVNQAEQFEHGKLCSAFLALGDECNISILKEIKKGPMTPQMIAATLHQPVRTIIEHLAVLREHEFISVSIPTSNCSDIYYTLNQDTLQKVSAKIMDF